MIEALMEQRSMRHNFIHMSMNVDAINYLDYYGCYNEKIDNIVVII